MLVRLTTSCLIFLSSSSSKVIFRISLASILALTCYSSGKSQKTLLYFQHLSTEQGLSSPQFNHLMHQDKFNRVWISSITGLNEFDGNRVRVHTADPEDPKALMSPRAPFSSIYESSDGDLWFTNVSAVLNYQSREDHFDRYFLHTEEGEVVEPEYMWMYLDTLTGTSFTYANDGIYLYNLYEPTTARKVLGQYFNYNTITQKLGKGTYQFIQHSSSGHFVNFYRFHLRDDTMTLRRIEQVPNGESINIVTQSEDRLWISTQEHLWELTLGHASDWVVHGTNYNGEVIKDIVDLEFISTNQLLIATREAGMYIYDLHGREIISKVYDYKYGEILPFEESIKQTYLDQQQNIWVSTASNGVWFANLNKLKLNPIQVEVEGKPTEVISIAEGQNKVTLILTPTRLYEISDADTTIYRLPLKGDGVEKPTFVFEDLRGNIWVGSLIGLLFKKPLESAFDKVNILPPEENKNIGFTAFHEIGNGEILFCTNQESILAYSTDTTYWVTPEVKRPFFAKTLNSYLFSATLRRELFIHKFKDLPRSADTPIFAFSNCK